jgi:hypothetical protein
LDAIAVPVAWVYDETDMEGAQASLKKIVAAACFAAELNDSASFAGAWRERSDVTRGT